MKGFGYLHKKHDAGGGTRELCLLASGILEVPDPLTFKLGRQCERVEVNGFLESGPAEDPYTETRVARAEDLFALLTVPGDRVQSNGLATSTPTATGTAGWCASTQSYMFYQGGPFVDAIVASGTPNAVAELGPANVVGRTYQRHCAGHDRLFRLGPV